MREMYKIFDKVIGTKAIVSFHLKSFPSKKVYLTIHDMDSNCHVYEGDSLEQVENQLVAEWGHLITPTLPPLPGFPKL